MNKKYSRELLMKAYKHTKDNMENLEPDETCGCFSCLSTFKAHEIREYQQNEGGKAALCPYCSDDAVLREQAGFPVNMEFLKTMNEFWFPGFGTYEYWWRLF